MSALISFFAGFALFYLIHKIKTGGFQRIREEILRKANLEFEKKEAAFALNLKERELLFQQEQEKKAKEEREKCERREERLERELTLIETKLAEVIQREKNLQKLRVKEQEIELELQKLASLTKEEAKTVLFEKISHEIEQTTGKIALCKKKEAEAEGDFLAAGILSTAINRMALTTVSQAASITVSLPNQEMKGRVIGREGRNIRALEQLTGVTFAIDDTPNAIVISGFDPIRKEVAKKSLKELIQDGRIHPTRIEEVVGRIQGEVEKQIEFFGKEAAIRTLGFPLHIELHKLLGKLNFMLNCGQNVLEHSLEVSHLMGMLAAELGFDASLAKRIGLLHDIGKAISHEPSGSHALIGKEYALRYGESEAVANGIGCHHEEIAPITIEGSLCSAANKISGNRPGARVEALEHYLKRSSRLEQLASEFAGVSQAWALQAGQEVRVIVEPDRFDDLATHHLARKIAEKIEHELSYPGKIKVTVIREKRVVEYAI